MKNEIRDTGLIRALSYCPLMVKTKKGKSAFTKKEIKNRTRQAKRSRDHIEEYQMNWFYYFEIVRSVHHEKNPWISVLAKKP